MLPCQKMHRNKPESFHVFAKVTGLAAFEKWQPVNLYKETTRKCQELFEGKRIAFYQCRKVDQPYAGIVQKIGCRVPKPHKTSQRHKKLAHNYEV